MTSVGNAIYRYCSVRTGNYGSISDDSTFWTPGDRIDDVDIEFWSLRKVQVMKEENGFHFGYTTLKYMRILGRDVN